MFEDAVAQAAVEAEAGGVVGDAVGGQWRGLGEVVGAGVGPGAAAPRAVLPVVGGWIAGADRQRRGGQDLDLQFLGLAGVAEVDDGALGVTGARAVGDLGLGPAELAVAVARADDGRVVQGAVAVGVLLDDDHEEPVLETDRAPDPVEALGRVVLGEPAALLAGDRPHPPTPVTRTGPAARGDPELLVTGADHTLHPARLHEAAPFEGEPVAAVLDVVGFPERGELGGPSEVVREGVVLAAQTEPAQGFLHLDAQGADREVHAVVAQGVRGADRVEGVAGAEGGVGVDHPDVRVDAEAEDEQGAALMVEDVEDASVVGVPVAGRYMLHRQGHLMHGVLVEGHGTVVCHG